MQSSTQNYPNNGGPTCPYHAHSPQPQYCNICSSIALTPKGQHIQAVPAAGQSYPRPAQYGAANSFTAPTATESRFASPAQPNRGVQGRLTPRHQAAPFVQTPQHDHYSDRFALSPKDREPRVEDHYPERYALSSEDESDSNTGLKYAQSGKASSSFNPTAKASSAKQGRETKAARNLWPKVHTSRVEKESAESVRRSERIRQRTKDET